MNWDKPKCCKGTTFLAKHFPHKRPFDLADPFHKMGSVSRQDTINNSNKEYVEMNPKMKA